jgi:hypothetical protein
MILKIVIGLFEEPGSSSVKKKMHKKFVSVTPGRDIFELEEHDCRETNTLHTVANKDARVQKKDAVKKYSKKKYLMTYILLIMKI